MSSHRPRKRFGQNFLHDPGVIRRIVDCIRPVPAQAVVEIGPGQGALTRPLLERLDHLDVIEIDRDLAGAMREQGYPPQRLSIHESDALQFDFSALATQRGQPLRLVGNLPYNISTPLLFHVLEHAEVIRDMHFMLQREVVRRMAAPPGGKEYGRLSVMLAWHCRVESLFDIAPGAFRPAPKVTSSLVRLIPHAAAPFEVGDALVFRNVVTRAFTQRRKTLRNALATLISAEQIAALDIDPGLRPQMLTPADFAAIARSVSTAQA
jgi:16S rRNA (adenine1518-N6/adenine1519-N6)-dimethyltransferase